MGKSGKSAAGRKKRTLLFIIVLLAAVLLIAVIATKSYLVINQLLGNDLAIRLEADRESVFAGHYENEPVEFGIYATTNPFCKIECSSGFYSLASGNVIESDNFNMTSAVPKNKEFVLSAAKAGTGQELYSFEVQCRSRKTLLCHTDERPVKRNVIVALNYGLNLYEKEMKNESATEIIAMLERLDYLSARLAWIESSAERLPMIEFPESFDAGSLDERLLPIKAYVSGLRQAWEQQAYDVLSSEFKNVYSAKRSLKELENSAELHSSALLQYSSEYNNLAGSFAILRGRIKTLASLNVSNETHENISLLVSSYNFAVSKLAQKSAIAEKLEAYLELNATFSLISLGNESIGDGAISYHFEYENISIAPEAVFLPEFSHEPALISLSEPEPSCCYLDDCKSCCTDSCKANPLLYPVILLHGHDFNSGVSAEQSLSTFQALQDKFDEDGYLNAGSIILASVGQESRGIWGSVRVPAVVKASYYFDIYTSSGKGRVIETKADSIDTYAIRLRDIVEDVKLKTNRDKVIIVAHSMGGLVSRRYMQIFGDSSVEKLIMIGTPNKGIDDGTLRYCKIFGEKLECDNMAAVGLFINKLNSFAESREKFYNIIGIGCGMNGDDGDGIVFRESAFLDRATNYFVHGSCDESAFSYLHGELLNPEKYPEVYKLLRGIISA